MLLRKSSSGKVNALWQLGQVVNSCPKWAKESKLKRLSVCVCAKEKRSRELEVIEKTATARWLGKSKEKLLIFISDKNAGVGTKKSSSASLRYLQTALNSMRLHANTYRTHTHTYIYLYRVQSVLSIYIYILIPRIFLCAFDAQHKLTLQTFCGLKSAASGNLSMASECNTPHPPPLGRVWGVASIVLNSYKAALNAPSCLSASLLAACHLNSSSIELVTRFLSCFSPCCGKVRENILMKTQNL